MLENTDVLDRYHFYGSYMAIKEFSGQFSTCCLTLINQDDLLNPRLTRTWMLAKHHIPRQ